MLTDLWKKNLWSLILPDVPSKSFISKQTDINSSYSIGLLAPGLTLSL